MSYQHINEHNFYLLKDHKLTALFVNSEEDPIDYIPYNNYRAKVIYTEGKPKYCFDRLYELVYLYNGIVKYSVFRFLPITVKPHLEEAMYCAIKLQEGLEEYINH